MRYACDHGLLRQATTGVLAAACCWLLPPSPRSLAQDLIEELKGPKPAAAPRLDEAQEERSDLSRKRRARQQRDPAPAAEEVDAGRQHNLALDALLPHARDFFVELALVIPGVSTQGARQGYTAYPTVLINAAWQLPKNSRQAAADLWVGARAAPFSGDGIYENHPGSYGLTYIGPMLGVGHLAPLPQSVGRSTAGPAERGPLPLASTHGWLVTTGVAAVSKVGRSAWPQARTSDFASKGLSFDAPGTWLEARYLHLADGAVGTDAVVGAQLGAGKVFYYAGLGAAAWN